MFAHLILYTKGEVMDQNLILLTYKHIYMINIDRYIFCKYGTLVYNIWTDSNVSVRTFVGVSSSIFVKLKSILLIAPQAKKYKTK